MPYYKHVWTAHEVPTDDKLNHIEEGIENATNAAESGGSGGSALVVRINFNEQTEVESLDKTWQEIYDATTSGSGAVVVNEYEDDGVAYQETFSVISMSSESGGSSSSYYLYLPTAGGTPEMWWIDSADGYPTRSY